KTLFYVSEVFGSSNVVRQPVPSPFSSGKTVEKPTRVTRHTDEGVRRARISHNGEWIVYECGADLWVVSTSEDAKPRKLAIEVNADEKTNNERVVALTGGATEFAVSADEKFIVFAVHGKLFRMPVSSKSRVTQLTFGSSNDHGVAWAPDGSKIIF